MSQLDEYDLSILRELQTNGNASMDELSDKVHLSRNAVWRRIKTLTENGVIKRTSR